MESEILQAYADTMDTMVRINSMATINLILSIGALMLVGALIYQIIKMRKELLRLQSQIAPHSPQESNSSSN